MKATVTFFSTLVLLISGVAQANTIVDADFEVRVYSNKMPKVYAQQAGMVYQTGHAANMLDREIYRVEATVQFCQDVESSDFYFSVRETEGVNFMVLSSPESFEDCDGELVEQVLVYPLPRSVNKKLPFAKIQPVPVIHEGAGY